MQPAISDNVHCAPLHTHLLAAGVQPDLDILILTFRNAQKDVDVSLVKKKKQS